MVDFSPLFKFPLTLLAIGALVMFAVGQIDELVRTLKFSLAWLVFAVLPCLLLRGTGEGPMLMLFAAVLITPWLLVLSMLANIVRGIRKATHRGMPGGTRNSDVEKS